MTHAAVLDPEEHIREAVSIRVPRGGDMEVGQVLEPILEVDPGSAASLEMGFYVEIDGKPATGGVPSATTTCVCVVVVLPAVSLMSAVTVSVLPSASVALGENTYALPCSTLVLGVPVIAVAVVATVLVSLLVSGTAGILAGMIAGAAAGLLGLGGRDAG